MAKMFSANDYQIELSVLKFNLEEIDIFWAAQVLCQRSLRCSLEIYKIIKL